MAISLLACKEMATRMEKPLDGSSSFQVSPAAQVPYEETGKL